MKVYNIRPSQFCKLRFLFLFYHSVVFTCSKVIREPTRFGKALNLIFPKLSSQNVRGFDQATILSPSFHGLSKERLTQLPPFVYKIRRKTLGSTSRKVGWGVRHPSWNPYPISEKNLWFSLPYFRPHQKLGTLFQIWSPGARRVTGARDKLLRHVQGWRKH